MVVASTGHEIFVDASAWVAAFYARDDHHERSRDIWLAATGGDWPLVTSNWTLYEALTVLRSRASYQHAQQLWAFVQESAVTIVDAKEVEDEALRLFWRYKEHTFSVVDCANFLVIRDRRCPKVFAFDDNHFGPAAGLFGFELLLP
ncbi:MAG: type II toxin-antitoxin system VapC family toxin [Chloroflexi bacterium]|nr:type II toxin-antitoxin system VapC family toxin [Chloroflexota bacterium]